MDNTFGGNRGITPSISKRVKRKVVRYNRDDYVSLTPITHKKGYGQYEDISRAKVADLEHYLGEDWIDWDCVYIPAKATESYRKRKSIKIKERSSAKLFRCVKCKRAYESGVLGLFSGSSTERADTYLNPSVFNNVPLDKKDCDSCG
tara:strand:+ start:567 stop:1007 length:441 start_codon:yes stop_codon:yes gene_type:complete